MAYKKPIPVPDELSAPFWQAAKERRLVIQRCQHCRTFSHPPDILCRECGDIHPEPALKFEPVSGRGRLSSWVVMRDAFLPGFVDDLPFVIAMVELEEQKGLRLIARLLDGPAAALKIGAPVQTVFEDITPEITLPQFRLSS